MPMDLDAERAIAARTPGNDRPDPALTIVPSDPAWAERYAGEAAAIREALGPVALRVEHVGSTSVPGLAAKPIVDIDVSVPDIADRGAYVEPLATLGYVFLPVDQDPEFHFFAKPAAPPRRFHTHVMQAGSAHELRSRAVRDYLRAHPLEAAMYARVKRTAMAAADGDRLRYMAGKDPYLTELVPRAIAWACAQA